MAAPAVVGRALRVIVGVIVLRHVDRRAGCDVAVVFLLERVAVIFEMVEDIERAMQVILDQTGPHLGRADQCDEPRRGVDLICAHLGPAAHGDHEIIRKSAQKGRGGAQAGMAETAKGLGRKDVFSDPVEIVDHRHPAPADAKGRMDMALRPVEHLRKLVPIGHLLEGQVFDRGAGDDEPVELFLAHLGKGAVELGHMLGGGVARLVRGHADQRQLDLQRRGADQPRELVLGLDLLGHQVQQADAQRPDILPRRLIVRHDHDPLAGEDVIGGERGGQLDRHQETCVERT